MRAAQTVHPPKRTPVQNKPDHPDWAQLLVDAVQQPGIVSAAYQRFWHFSIGNQLLAAMECLQRNIELGPIHTFKGWLDLGRHVRKGEKAITLCMPVQVKRKLVKDPLDAPAVRIGDGAERQLTGAGGNVSDNQKSGSATVFVFRPHWFVLSQTDGEPYQPQELPTWSEARALNGLLINHVAFQHSNGNCQGYALDRSVAVSPIAALPHKTLFHELAHVVLGHTEEGGSLDDHDLTPRNLREVEAECVAFICCESLNLAGAPECRGYIQGWLGKDQIPDRSAQKIFKSADAILKAGYPQPSGSPAETSA